jgi:predicted MFS family arabinose efflux permease
MVPPLGGWLVGSAGYPATFAVAALFPLVAVAMVPVRDERPLE